MIDRIEILNLANEVVRDIDENSAFMLVIEHYLKTNKSVRRKDLRKIKKTFNLANKSLNDLKYQVIPIISDLKSNKIISDKNISDCFNKLCGCKLDIKEYNNTLIDLQEKYITRQSY
ncbi:hypothetical protein [Romboutsia timonensis]|uniref:hypothetical protein n=1 Tax=Romboutsia timonensis TaxID=1776391 RepID=UPI002A837D8D|nr:hypothetical protein [Romboutsia timonensis]MDY3960984.1 hypothetical protein [Romboutsia timonensis]